MNGKKHSALSAVILVLTLIISFTASAANYEIAPLADSYVNSLYPNTNYGSDERLYAHYGSNSTKRTFLRFDLTGLPAGEIITGASLLLYTDGGVQGLAVDAHHVANDAWTEDLLTWNNQPGYDAFVLHSAETVHGWMEWSIPLETFTADTDGLLSILIKLGSESGDSATATFYSREATIKPAELPYLSVSTTTPVPIPPAMLLFGIGLVVLAGVRRNID
ncbi:MAG: DNRLRE domain-containing protein [Salinivirgaceae bacterium]|nr:DNRLRE domain-containing protein [Salinivirgaceae bacterium]